jgi:hypothetical protein
MVEGTGPISEAIWRNGIDVNFTASAPSSRMMDGISFF